MLDWNMARANQERYADMIRKAERRRSLKAVMATTNDRPRRATHSSDRFVGLLAAVLIALRLSR